MPGTGGSDDLGLSSGRHQGLEGPDGKFALCECGERLVPRPGYHKMIKMIQQKLRCAEFRPSVSRPLAEVSNFLDYTDELPSDCKN